MSSYRTFVEWRGKSVETLADILAEDILLLFIGLNPRPESVDKGHYHQGGLGQQFWRLLVDYRILPRPLLGQFHDEILLINGLGITDIVKVPSLRADSIDRADIAYGRKVLQDKISRLKPKVVCSVYKKAVEELCGISLTNRWGLLDERIEGCLLFVLPFPYRPAAEVRMHMMKLCDLVKERRHV